ncbi:MAG TPA: hypothetical protein VHQ87_00675, partial [Rhizobacter sp.]|nr:hypothetical protein [Rhizobacter sp.]
MSATPMNGKTARCAEPALRGRGQVRLFHDGCLFASSDAVLQSRRYSASLLIAITETDFEIEIDGRTERHGVAALRPFVARRLNARNVPYVCLDLTPEHPLFRAFSAIPGNGCLGIPRARFASLAGALRDFHAGAMAGCKESQRLYHRATNLAATVLPAPRPLDPRVQRVMRLLGLGLAFSVSELARHCCISPDRLSHLLSQELGITLRQYTQWLK